MDRLFDQVRIHDDADGAGEPGHAEPAVGIMRQAAKLGIEVAQVRKAREVQRFQASRMDEALDVELARLDEVVMLRFGLKHLQHLLVGVVILDGDACVMVSGEAFGDGSGDVFRPAEEVENALIVSMSLAADEGQQEGEKVTE